MTMRNHAVRIGLVTSMLVFASSQVSAKSVCYENSVTNGTAFLRLDVGYHSKLTTRHESKKFGDGHPVQKTYSVQGSSVEDFIDVSVIGTVDGTVVVAKGNGARMGITNHHFSIITGYGQSNFACISDEVSATPEKWQCEGIAIGPGGAISLDSLRLTRVDPLDNPLCSEFNLTFDDS